jgi:hypothetical protein
MIANAEETTKVCSISDIIDFKKQGREASTVIGFELLRGCPVIAFDTKKFTSFWI